MDLTRWCGFLAYAAIVVVLGAPAGVAAKECGGAVACACGDSVRGTAVLAQDLVGCVTGLRVKSAAVLDCAGHAIVGAVPDANEGIVVEADGATVRACTVYGFKTGIRIRAGGRNVVSGNDVVGNTRYGIELAVATTYNEIRDNLVLDSGDEGIHVGTRADWNVIARNEIAGSKRENLYLLDVVGCTIAENHISGGGAAAMYVKHSGGNAFTDNEVADRPVQVRGESEENVFAGNRLARAGFLFQAYKDAKRGWKGPRENQIRNGSVSNVKTCFRFEGAAANEVSGVLVDGCQPMAQKKAGGIAAVNNSVDVVRAD